MRMLSATNDLSCPEWGVGRESLTIITWPTVLPLQVSSVTTTLPSPYQVVSKDVAQSAAAKSLQSCSTLREPIDSSPPGSHVPGILQARTLEWVAIFSDSQSRNPKFKVFKSQVRGCEWVKGVNGCDQLETRASLKKTASSSSVLGLWPDLHMFFRKSQKAGVLCENSSFLNTGNSFKFKTNLQAGLRCLTSETDCSKLKGL